MSSPKEMVTDYYPAIDRVDHDTVLSLFAPDAVYKRADVEYRNLAEIRDFFCEKRQIRGRHTIDRIWTDRDGMTVLVTGAFDGEGEAGDPRSVKFADIWHFNDAGLVRERQTYLAMGHAYVER